MDVGSIADASMAMSMANTQQAVGTTVLRKTLDMEQTEGISLIQSMQESAPSNHILDMLV
ncbi:putative motility protein [Caprobacter fermentans]|uniref:Putative motility protein n=1 Tax=Caproicibacter fermentans TaxID=2576756 RepID=A0A6N8HZD2_9FIRM|nr:YjfB family protein [Caproicibacter fermentans]MVB11214.1 putative motility protein [Caproicibacter fermentans]OCN00083.1 hypothetical protein A7X67_17440 [Clostridium sp. W14A]QNK41974.1 YjfB family protein [Caproicibacter fermentans]